MSIFVARRRGGRARGGTFQSEGAVFRLFGRKLKTMGFEALDPEEIVREGMKSEEITKLIEEDEDIGGARPRRLEGPSGPGPLVANLAGGRLAGTFPVPLTVVPGHLSLEESSLWLDIGLFYPDIIGQNLSGFQC